MRLNCDDRKLIGESKRKLKKVQAELEKIVSGRAHSLLPFVTDSEGRYNERKGLLLIGELMADMNRSANQNLLWFGDIMSEDAVPAQKKFRKYMETYLYLVIRTSQLRLDWLRGVVSDLPDGTFDNILTGCVDFNSEDDKDSLLCEYNFSGYVYERGIIAWCMEIYEYINPDPGKSWLTEDMRSRMLKASDEITDGDFAEYIDDELDGEVGPDDSEVDDDIYDIDTYMDEMKPSYDYDFNIIEYLLDRIENPEFFCEKFRSFMSMIYSGEVPLSYLSNVKNAVEGMLDTFLSEHRMSMFIDDRNMAKTVVYIQKAMEKADLLYRRNYGEP